MSKTSIAGLEVDTFTKPEFLSALAARLGRGEKTFVITPYSEFLYAALRDREVMAMFNKADIAIPDGIGILWAQRFLALPFSTRFYYLKILQALWQVIYSGAGILLYPKSIYRTFPEKITGADIVWDVAELAAKNNYSVYLLGSMGDVPQRTAGILQQKFPRLKIAGASNKGPGDEAEILADLEKTRPDILLVTYGPVKQEKWITENYNRLPVKLIIGLGGTFDYIAGHKKAPPRFIRKAGLEWLYRLVTQPRRAGRIKNATWGLILALLRYKVFASLPYRDNAVAVVFNAENKILVAKRRFTSGDARWFGVPPEERADHWQFSQGGVQSGEDLVAAARRELKEELNLTSVEFMGKSGQVNTYQYNNGRRNLWRNPSHHNGQKQHIVYFRFNGNDSEIKADNHEFTGYQWLDAGRLRAEVHLLRQPIADIVLSDIAERKILEKPA